MSLYVTHPGCVRCGAALDSLHHQFWECPVILEKLGEVLQPSQHLAAQAKDDAEHACFWQRGLVPAQWLQGSVLQDEDICVRHWGLFQEYQVVDLPQPAYAGTDGSGGTHGTDVALRRVGWGVALLATQRLIPVGAMMGGVPGAQTVPRAELMAVVKFLEKTRGSVVIFCDAMYVVKGWHKRKHSSNIDLWKRLDIVRETRPGVISIEKVKAHATDADVESEQVSLEALGCNTIADVLAQRAAALNAMDAHVVCEVTRVRNLACMVANRLLVIAKFLVTSPELLPACTREVPGPHRLPWRDKWKVMAQATTRNVGRLAKHVKCTICKRGSGARASLLWLQSPCVRPKAATQATTDSRIHHSHKAWGVRGVIHCLKCGAWMVRRAVLLAKPCPGNPVTDACMKSFKAFKGGRLPPGLKEWPQGA